MGVFNNCLFVVLLSVVLLVYLFSEYFKTNLIWYKYCSMIIHNLKQESTDNVISERLKDPNTLEQEMVDNMYETTSSEHPRLTPRYQPLLPNMAGASLVE